MENYRAIPPGYMTIGELAKKMGITVRTLHHYDKSGLLSPSSESEGGFRLYSDKDMVKLHQILSMKHLGFSLSDIKDRLISLETPADVTKALADHAAGIRMKIQSLSESLGAIEALKSEVEKMQTVDFGKYAIIIGSLQMKNEYYWMVKHFDDEIIQHFHTQFDSDSAKLLINNIARINKKALQLKADGIQPQSEKGQDLAKDFWNTILEATGGDMSLITKLSKGYMNEKKDEPEQDELFIHEALGYYLESIGEHELNNLEPDMEENK